MTGTTIAAGEIHDLLAVMPHQKGDSMIHDAHLAAALAAPPYDCDRDGHIITTEGGALEYRCAVCGIQMCFGVRLPDHDSDCPRCAYLRG